MEKNEVKLTFNGFISKIFLLSVGLHLCSALVCVLYMEVKQEVGIRDSSTFRSENSPFV